MLLMIDNYDSFTYNLVQYLAALDADVRVYRNDAISRDEALALEPDHVVLSPGPGTPDDAGVSLELVDAFAGRAPLLGVCLGHQCIAQAFGGRIVHARQVMHGKPSLVHHDGTGLFAGLPSPFEAIRYHSLVADAERLPDCLAVSATTRDAEGNVEAVMGLRHRRLPVVGVQFHPEAFFTRFGHELLRNFLGNL